MCTGRKYLSICTIALGLITGSALGADASSQLTGMAEKLAKAKQFSVVIHMSYDVTQNSGQTIQFSEIRRVQISRPNHLRVDARQSDGDTGGLIYDGKTITQFSDSENVYAQIAHAGDIDTAVRYAVSQLDIRVPLARMLVSSFPQELQELGGEPDYIEQDMLYATPTDHIAGRTDSVDYQFWIDQESLPSRIVLTYRNAPGQPQFRADFSDWQLEQEIKDSTFIFTPPKGAERIPVLLPTSNMKAMDNTSGGAQ